MYFFMVICSFFMDFRGTGYENREIIITPRVTYFSNFSVFHVRNVLHQSLLKILYIITGFVLVILYLQYLKRILTSKDTSYIVFKSIIKLAKHFPSEVYLGSCQTSMVEPFCENKFSILYFL